MKVGTQIRGETTSELELAVIELKLVNVVVYNAGISGPLLQSPVNIANTRSSAHAPLRVCDLIAGPAKKGAIATASTKSVESFGA